jgi:membrane protein YqaA with SNARE-associated domain
MRKSRAVNALLLVAIVAAVFVIFSLSFYFLSQISATSWSNFGYAGVFLLSLVGASSVIIPVPYTVILLTISPAFDLIPFAIAAGAGSAVGELVGYGVGRIGRAALVGRKYLLKMDAMQAIFKRYGIIVIFLFALTPLPDDLLFIPLGLMGYSIWKALAASMLGKFFAMLAIAYVGNVAGWLFFESWEFGVVVAALLAVLVVAIFKVDWEKLAKKYAKKSR